MTLVSGLTTTYLTAPHVLPAGTRQQLRARCTGRPTTTPAATPARRRSRATSSGGSTGAVREPAQPADAGRRLSGADGA